MNFSKNIMEKGLKPNQANYFPLSPISFLTRTANIWPERTAWIHGKKKNTYKQLLEKCTLIASGLRRKGISQGDTVAALLPNVPAMIECHFAILMAGAVLNTINIRLDVETIAYILEHSDAKLFIVDTQFSPVIKKTLELISRKIPIIDIVDNQTQQSKYLLSDPHILYQLLLFS